MAPLIIAKVATRIQNRRTVQQALINESWESDIQEGLSNTALIQFFNLRQAIASVQRNLEAPDTFSCPTASSVYSVRSVYQYLCQGLQPSPTASSIW